jgi:predicted dinucleotide-binding enzyme
MERGGGYDQGVILANILLDGNSYRVIAPSRFGFLHTPVSDATNNKSSFAAQADAYANLLDKLNIKKVAVIGFSAGGPSWIEFVLRHPGGPPTMFICGNDDQAKKTVIDNILTKFGWETIEIGGIEGARLLEPLAFLWIMHYFRTGNGNHAFKLLRK